MPTYSYLKIAFVIPVYKHDPSLIINEIKNRFPQSLIILIDDGEGLAIKSSGDIVIIKHSSNLGLAQSLMDGYERALQEDIDVIVKVDADGEYPIYPVKKIIHYLYKYPYTSGGFVELKRNILTNGVIDGLFHIIFGTIEGLLLFKKNMCQHSPGLQIYKKQTLIKIFPKVKKIHDRTKQKWGLDLVFLFLANHEGEIIPYTISNHNWKERRSKLKIVRQIIATSSLLTFLKYYLIANPTKRNSILNIGNYATSSLDRLD